MADQPAYRVVKQTHSRQYHPTGEVSGQWTVQLEHPDGTRSQVVVPEQVYTPEMVHKLAMAQADKVNAVANLPGSLGASQ